MKSNFEIIYYNKIHSLLFMQGKKYFRNNFKKINRNTEKNNLDIFSIKIIFKINF